MYRSFSIMVQFEYAQRQDIYMLRPVIIVFLVVGFASVALGLDLGL